MIVTHCPICHGELRITAGATEGEGYEQTITVTWTERHFDGCYLAWLMGLPTQPAPEPATP